MFAMVNLGRPHCERPALKKVLKYAKDYQFTIYIQPKEKIIIYELDGQDIPE